MNSYGHFVHSMSRGSSEALRIGDYLHDAWVAQFSQPVSSFEVDLERLSPLFAQNTPAQKVRAAARSLRPVDRRRPWIPEDLYVEFDEKRGFVTPEGRAFLEWVEDPQVRAEEIAERLGTFYGAARRQWLRKEVVGGRAAPPTLGFVLFLLLNGNVSAERAFAIPSNKSEEEALASRVMLIPQAFAGAVGAGEIAPREQSRLRGNWILTEAGRKLVHSVSADKLRGQSRIYVQADAVERAEGEIAAAIVRRNAASPASRDALQEAEAAYALARPYLVSKDLAFSDPAASRAVVRRIEAMARAEES